MLKTVIDAVVYINLDYRQDRKEQIEEEIKKLNMPEEKIFRIKAYRDPFNGTRGCARSHIHALQLAMINNWKNVLILEDDCVFVKDSKTIEKEIFSLFENFKETWRVFLLGGRMKIFLDTDFENIKEIRWSSLAHAYIVNNHYYSTLLRSFFRSYKLTLLDDNFTQSMEKGIDQQWVFLQMLGNWYAPKEILTKQRLSYSDIGMSEKEPQSGYYSENKLDHKKMEEILSSLSKKEWESMLNFF